MARAISIDQLYRTKRNVLPFNNKWKDFMGSPECKGSIIIWGASGNGKTRFAVMLADYLSTFKKVVYNSIEEGDSATLARAFQECGITADNKNLTVLNIESLYELRDRLSKHKSPDIVVVDSLQHWRINEVEYKQLVTEFNNKLFIFISHADGKEPAKAIGMAVKYDANVKIYIDRFVAFATSRCEGCKGQPFVIWEEQARVLYGMNFDEMFEQDKV